MKYRLVIFDSDGTLADTLPWMRTVFNDLATEHGFKSVEAGDYEKHRDLHGREMLRALGLPLWKLPFVVRDMRRRMAAHPGNFHLFPGLGEALRRLSAGGVKLAVVSSNSRANVERVLGPQHTALLTALSCDVSMFGKTARLRAVVRASGIPRSAAIYVGDEIRDAEAARRAGLAFGAVAWGQHSGPALRAQQPEEFFETVEDLVAKLS